jgi:hypothetical protein
VKVYVLALVGLVARSDLDDEGRKPDHGAKENIE